jgi:hypothetical protein
MLSVAHSLSRRLFKPLAFSLALLSLLFLIQVFPHAHANNHEEAACQICQVSHLGVTPAVATITLSIPFVSFGEIVLAETCTPSETLSSRSSSRAPPVCLPS